MSAARPQRTFTADPALWDAVQRAAARAGMTTSEWICAALKDCLRPVYTAGGAARAGRAYPKDVQVAHTPKGSGGPVRK